jgi:hypothetical protein
MKKLRKYLVVCSLMLGFMGAGEPILNEIGVSAVTQVQAQTQQNTDVSTAGENIRSSVIQVALIIYNRLRWPVSFLMMVGTIGLAMWKRREGMGLIMTAGAFTFLWAFAPVVAKFFMGLAGVSDTTTITIN